MLKKENHDRLAMLALNDPDVYAAFRYIREGADTESMLTSLVIHLARQRDKYKDQLLVVMQNSPTPIIIGGERVGDGPATRGHYV